MYKAMPLTRQTTYINPKFRKKTMPSTRKKNAYKKKGAYNPRNKRQFKNARRPFVEGKRRSL
jgi:hypothetical protein